MEKKKRIWDCQVIRTKMVTTYKFNCMTGEERDHKREWKTEICGSPLFGNGDDTRNGICASCSSGWINSENYPVDPKELHELERKPNKIIFDRNFY